MRLLPQARYTKVTFTRTLIYLNCPCSFFFRCRLSDKLLLSHHNITLLNFITETCFLIPVSILYYKRPCFFLYSKNISSFRYEYDVKVAVKTTGWLKKQQLRFKSAIFHVMSWKFGFNIIRRRGIRIWNRIRDISIQSAPKLRSKNQKNVNSLFVRILNFK